MPRPEVSIHRCRCGKVEVEIAGPPILVAACHCDDCQAGAARLSALPDGPSVLDEYAGTPSVLYRKDRVRIVAGKDLVQPLKLQPKSPTNRLFASCCNTPLMVSFDNALHWLPVYPVLLGDKAPPLEMRVNTRFIPEGVRQPQDVPAYRSFPPRFVLKLVAARVAMAFGR